jgi:hypothetical protein
MSGGPAWCYMCGYERQGTEEFVKVVRHRGPSGVARSKIVAHLCTGCWHGVWDTLEARGCAGYKRLDALEEVRP